MRRKELGIYSRMEDWCPITEIETSSQTFTRLWRYEPYPIFEHNIVHVYTNLKTKGEIFYFEHSGKTYITCFREGKFGLFAPPLTDYKTIVTIVKELANFNSDGMVEIKNVSKWWLDDFLTKIPPEDQNIWFWQSRSKEEAVYDLDYLVKLEGKNLATIRSARNRLLDSGKLQFQLLGYDNLKDALLVRHRWQKIQGGRYKKNRSIQEIASLEFFAKNNKIESYLTEIGYLDGIPVSFFASFLPATHPTWAINYLIKGLNRPREGGIRGVSDATYLQMFRTLHKRGIKYLNDGELGYEPGTRSHKLHFAPVMYLQSFDMFYKPDRNI